MPFQKGNKYGGRQKGALNTRTYIIDQLRALKFDFLPRYLAIVDEIDDPAKKARALEPMMQFIYTKPTQEHELSIQELIAHCREAVEIGTDGTPKAITKAGS